MTPKQKMREAVRATNHAKLMLQTAAAVEPRADGYREDYLQWAEAALLRASRQVGSLRNRTGTKKIEESS